MRITNILEKIWRFVNWWILIGLGLIITGFQALKSGIFYAGKYGQIYPGKYGALLLLLIKFFLGLFFLMFGVVQGLRVVRKDDNFESHKKHKKDKKGVTSESGLQGKKRV